MKTNIRFFLSYLAHFFSEREIFKTGVAEKSKHRLCICNFFFLNRAVYEIVWENVVERDRPQMKMWLMRIACLIPKTTNTHSE